jgi:hypothetical protein
VLIGGPIKHTGIETRSPFLRHSSSKKKSK